MRNGNLLGLLLVSTLLSATATKASATEFLNCGFQCRSAKHYIGYNRYNSAALDSKNASLPQQYDKIFPQIVDLKRVLPAKGIDEQSVDLENGNYVSSVHRLDAIRIGFKRKSELMNVVSKTTGAAKASVKMFWGDTLTISSTTLPVGTPVKLQINRQMGGFGAPVTDFAYYNARSQTFLNKQPLAELDYELDKKPGPGQSEKMTGKSQANTTIVAKVGDVLTLESVLIVDDGVTSGSTPQTLNGADSVEHQIKVLTPGVKVNSDSGVFTTP
jgi:hypothetical protein